MTKTLTRFNSDEGLQIINIRPVGEYIMKKPSKDRYENLPVQSLKKVLCSLDLKWGRYNKLRPLKVLIVGYFGMRNVGDDVILSVEIDHIESLPVPVTITVPSKYPNAVIKNYNVASFRLYNIFEIMKTVIASDVVVIGGGGLFGRPAKVMHLKAYLINILLSLEITGLFVLLPKLLKKKVVFFGIGIYDNANKVVKKLSVASIQRSDYVSVRDRHSYEFLKPLLPNNNVKFHKDVAFLYNIDSKNGNEVGGVYDIKQGSDKNKVALSLVWINDEMIANNILRVISQFVNRNKTRYDFYFFSFYENPSGRNDYEYGYRLKALLDDQNFLHMISPNFHVREFLYVYSKMDISICMRLHAQIFAYIFEVPFLGISYDEKCESFMRDINATFLEMGDINISKIESSINNIVRK